MRAGYPDQSARQSDLQGGAGETPSSPDFETRSARIAALQSGLDGVSPHQKWIRRLREVAQDAKRVSVFSFVHFGPLQLSVSRDSAFHNEKVLLRYQPTSPDRDSPDRGE
jgi:hypothetical protein